MPFTPRSGLTLVGLVGPIHTFHLVTWATWPGPPSHGGRVGAASGIKGQDPSLTSPSSSCCCSPRSINLIKSLPYSEKLLTTCSWLCISLQPPPSSFLGEYKELSTGCLLSQSCLSSAPSAFLLYFPSGATLHKITQDLSDNQGPPFDRTLDFVTPCGAGCLIFSYDLGLLLSVLLSSSSSVLLPALHTAAYRDFLNTPYLCPWGSAVLRVSPAPA